jgi:hypothetical protein
MVFGAEKMGEIARDANRKFRTHCIVERAARNKIPFRDRNGFVPQRGVRAGEFL